MGLGMNKLMSKNGRAIMLLAREMFSYEVGDRIRTISAYVELLDISRGTVQSALKFLREDNCILLESRGHLGTFLVKVDHKKLWGYSDFGVIMGAMPLPYSKRYEGLATGLYMAFEEKEIPFSLAFMRGANKRIEALNFGKYNFAILSKLAAETQQKTHQGLHIVHEFQPGSYVGNHVVIFREETCTRIQDGMRVGFDATSIDQSMLTEVECEDLDVSYVATPYNQILQKLDMNEIDAAIWNVDEIKEKNLDFHVQPLRKELAQKLDYKGTVATIVVSTESLVIGRIMRRLLELDAVEEIQKRVIEDKIMPMY